MTLTLIIFSIVMLHLVAGLGWVLYRIFIKPNTKVDNDNMSEVKSHESHLKDV